jgi:F-type H+-transporting ATPase subunit a
MLIGALTFAQDHGHDEAVEAVAVAEEHPDEAHDASHAPEKFNPGKLIMEHIADAHSWHLWGHTSLPLPVILWTDKGLETFSSGRLMDEHHEPVPYQGEHHTYLLKGKDIVALDAAGNVDESAGILDLSITKNVASLLMSVALLLLLFIGAARGYKKRPNQAPRGLQSFLEPIILFIRDNVARNSIGGKKYEKYVPYLLTLFFFIWINNLIGLIPIFPFGANVTGNIAIPLVLAVISFFIVTLAANWNYWRHMLAMPGVPWPVF